MTQTGHMIKTNKYEIIVSGLGAPDGAPQPPGGSMPPSGGAAHIENINTVSQAAIDQAAVLDPGAGSVAGGPVGEEATDAGAEGAGATSAEGAEAAEAFAETAGAETASAGVSAETAGEASSASAEGAESASSDAASAADVAGAEATAAGAGTAGAETEGETSSASAEGAEAASSSAGAETAASAGVSPEAAPPPLADEVVTEHSASKWRYIPTPEGGIEPSPEYAAIHESCPGGELIGARARGKKHKHEGTYCDDWFTAAQAGGWIILAMSDGAGSKQYSRIGAKVSCEAAAAYLQAAVTGIQARGPDIQTGISSDFGSASFGSVCGELASAVQSSVIAAFDAVEKAFLERAAKPEYASPLGRALEFNDFSGTLLIALISPACLIGGRTERLVVSFQIGDGITALLDSSAPFDASIKLMGQADGGDYSGETDFLASSRARLSASLQGRTKISRGAFDILMMMTDGVADDYFPNGTELRRLYFDLVANGIVPNASVEPAPGTYGKDDISIIKKLPDPLAYPWVNDPSQQVALQYTKRICGAMGLSLKDIWENRKILSLAAAEMSGLAKAKGPSERLKTWLDNYVERGSFDDRTLAVLRFW